MTNQEVLDRLAQFLKPSRMPISDRQISAWVHEAKENGGYIEVSRLWTLSGHTELFTL